MESSGEMEQHCWNLVFQKHYNESLQEDEYCRFELWTQNAIQHLGNAAVNIVCLLCLPRGLTSLWVSDNFWGPLELMSESTIIFSIVTIMHDKLRQASEREWKLENYQNSGVIKTQLYRHLCHGLRCNAQRKLFINCLHRKIRNTLPLNKHQCFLKYWGKA